MRNQLERLRRKHVTGPLMCATVNGESCTCGVTEHNAILDSIITSAFPTASGPNQSGCPDCHRPQWSAAVDDGGKMSPVYCWRDVGRYGATAAMLDCQRAQIARLTAHLAAAEEDSAAVRRRLRAKHASVESLLDQWSKAEGRCAQLQTDLAASESALRTLEHERSVEVAAATARAGEAETRLKTMMAQATFLISDVRAFEDALSEFFAAQSPDHEEDCPGDDTCECEDMRALNAAGPPMQKSITRLSDAMREADAAFAALRAGGGR